MSEKDKKRQIAKITVFITSIFVIFMSVTYAFITQLLTGEKQVVINAGVLDLVLEEENEITISDALPMYDEVGMIQDDVFVFRLVNKTSNKTDYVLKLSDITTGDKLDTSIVKYGLTKEDEKTIDLLSNLTKGVIDEGTINGNDTIDYTLRLWIDSEVTDDALISGKNLSYRIDVEASQPQPYQARYGELYSATIDGMQAGIIFNEDGSALMYSDYVQQVQFEAGTFTFDNENITSTNFNFKVSKDGKELYFGEANEQITLNLIERGGDILFGKKYSITVDGATISITLNEDGSYSMVTPDGSQTAPAGTMYCKDGSIYYSETNELMAYVMDDGNMVNYQGMLFKYTYITVKIHDDNYKLDTPIPPDSNILNYNVTDKFYTKEDLLGSYIVFQTRSNGTVDAYYLSSDFIDSNTDDDGVIKFRSQALWSQMIFVPEGHTYEEPYSGLLLEKGSYFSDPVSMFNSSYTLSNIIISKSIDNPILLDAKNNSEADSYDMDLTDTENILYHVSDEYFEVDELLNSTLIEVSADMFFTKITSDKITQISENIYMIDDGIVYRRYFCKEDTYLDTDGDGVDDKYYKKGIYVEVGSEYSSFDATGMKIVKYQP